MKNFNKAKNFYKNSEKSAINSQDPIAVVKTMVTELKRSMEYLGEKKDTLFVGQAVEVPGTAMSNTLKNVDKNGTFALLPGGGACCDYDAVHLLNQL